MVIIITRAGLKLKKVEGIFHCQSDFQVHLSSPKLASKKEPEFGVEDLGYIPAT